jgi:hypothetical protein
MLKQALTLKHYAQSNRGREFLYNTVPLITQNQL